MTTIKNMTEKKNQSLIGFLSANKISNYNRRGINKKKRKQRKKAKKIYRISKKIRKTYVFLESLLSEYFPKLEITVHFTSL